MPGSYSVHGRPASYVSSFPVVFCWIFGVFLKIISARVLKPCDPSSLGIALEHERAIVVADNNIGQTITADIDSQHGDGRVELGNLVFGPCYNISAILAVFRGNWSCSHSLKDRSERLRRHTRPLQWGCRETPQSQRPDRNYVLVSISALRLKALFLRDNARNFVVLAEVESFYPVAVFPITIDDGALEDRDRNSLMGFGHSRKKVHCRGGLECRQHYRDHDNSGRVDYGRSYISELAQGRVVPRSASRCRPKKDHLTCKRSQFENPTHGLTTCGTVRCSHSTIVILQRSPQLFVLRYDRNIDHHADGQRSLRPRILRCFGLLLA